MNITNPARGARLPAGGRRPATQTGWRAGKLVFILLFALLAVAGAATLYAMVRVTTAHRLVGSEWGLAAGGIITGMVGNAAMVVWGAVSLKARVKHNAIRWILIILAVLCGAASAAWSLLFLRLTIHDLLLVSGGLGGPG